MSKQLNKFARQMQMHYIVKSLKITATLIFLTCFIGLITGDLGLSLMETMGLASLGLVLKDIIKNLQEAYAAKSTLEDLNITFVESKEDLEASIDKISKQLEEDKDE